MPARIQELQGISVWVVTVDGNIVPLNEQLFGASSAQLLWERDNIADPLGVTHKTTPLRFIAVHRFTGTIAPDFFNDFINPIQIMFMSSSIYNPLGLKTLWNLPIAATDKLAPTPYLAKAHFQGAISTSAGTQANCPFFFQLHIINLDPNNPVTQSASLVDTTIVPAPSGSGKPSTFAKTRHFKPSIRADGVRLDIETWNTRLTGTNTVSGMMILEFVQSLQED